MLWWAFVLCPFVSSESSSLSHTQHPFQWHKSLWWRGRSLRCWWTGCHLKTSMCRQPGPAGAAAAQMLRRCQHISWPGRASPGEQRSEPLRLPSVLILCCSHLSLLKNRNGRASICKGAGQDSTVLILQAVPPLSFSLYVYVVPEVKLRGLCSVARYSTA